MKKFLVVAFVLLALPLAAAGEVSRLSVDAIFSDEGLVTRGLENVRWSPDGKRASWILRDAKGETGDLFYVDAESGKTGILVPKDQLSFLAPPVDRSRKNEREKERRIRYSISAYHWAPDGRSILFVGPENLWILDLGSREARKLTEPGETEDPTFSPDGTLVSFVRDHDLWVVPTAGGAPRRLTTGGTETLLRGELDWVYPEELELRSGYAWSPDSKRIAFLELDESPVAVTPIVDSMTIPPTVSFQRYPKAGTPNPKARVGIVPAGGGEVSWLDTPAAFEYVPRIDWADDDTLAVQYLDRRQSRLDLQLVSMKDLSRRTPISETDANWVNVSDDLQFLPGGEILWSSERDGRRHLYVFDRAGKLLRRLTDGKWTVASVAALDPVAGRIYFTSTEKNPTERHLCRVPVGGGPVERLTTEEGTHLARMNPQGTAAIDRLSSWSSPPAWQLLRFGKTGTTRTPLLATKLAAGVVPPKGEAIEVITKDGALVRGELLRPAGLDPSRKYPLLVYVYGGPQVPVVENAWGGARMLWHWMMTERGFAVLLLDDRTSSLPGHLYEIELKGRFGSVELADHREALEKIVADRPWLDRGRIGLWGWSGGGYTTVWNMFHAPDLFRAGVAVAGLYDFRTYDTIWTERYMGLPAENGKAYEGCSVIGSAGGLRGKLLLVHGDSDDNVHVQNLWMLSDALVRAGRPFDQAVYPGKTHSIGGKSFQRHFYSKMTEWLETNLAGAK